VGSAAELPPGTSRAVTVGDLTLTLLNADGRVVALGGICLRCSRPLSMGAYANGILTCAGCGWKYNVREGCVEGLVNLHLEVHDVCIEDGRLLVDPALAGPCEGP
jgi:nitrite reductase/ring-hydroxylating ferredoxin subunit